MNPLLPGLDQRLERLERPPVITLTTDFGLRDGYVGSMKGVIYTLLPDAKVVDIGHEVEAQGIEEGAFVLYRAYRYFPASAVHLAVVDPGVGTSRRPIVLVTRHGTFVGPDNGIFTYVLRAEQAPVHAPDMEGRPAWAGGMWGVAPNWAGDTPPAGEAEPPPPADGQPRAYHISNPHYWLPSVSGTFHGRDIFAPVAAHLASGAQPGRMGEEVSLRSLVKLPTGAPRIHTSARGTTMVGQIVYVDRFGNIITNLAERLLMPLISGAAPDEPRVVVEVSGHKIAGLRRAYGEVGEGEALALMGSERLLEIAVRNASAAQRMKVRIGDPVRVIVEKREQP